MEDYLKKKFVVDAKRPSENSLRRWRSAVWLVKNRRRRFRILAAFAKRSEAEDKRLQIQEQIRIALFVRKAGLRFIYAADETEGYYQVSKEVKQAGFDIGPDELASIVRSHDIERLLSHGGTEGLAKDLSVSLENGLSLSEISTREKFYGQNKFAEKSPPFWMFMWDAIQDLTLIMLVVCAVISVEVGIATEGYPKGVYDGIGIILSIFLVVLVTSVRDYNQSLQLSYLDKEKRNIKVHVTRNGARDKVSIYNLVVGDIVNLSVGDQVPADGLFISGYRLLIDESSLSGESEPVITDKKQPFLLSGTKVQDGSGKMLVIAVGMRTEWGRLMVTLSEGGEDETPLQVKLNGVATIIGEIGLVFAVLTFVVLTVRLIAVKYM